MKQISLKLGGRLIALIMTAKSGFCQLACRADRIETNRVVLVLGSQFAFAAFSPQASQSPLILVGSTLIIAALFQPLRHGIQRIIDRRFYRSRYDAAKTVAAFSANLRQEVDLDQLREQLLAVVQQTMQPASLSLWIRPSEQRKASGGAREEYPSHREEQPDADRSDSQ